MVEEGRHGSKDILAAIVALIMFGWKIVAHKIHLAAVQFHHQLTWNN